MERVAAAVRRQVGEAARLAPHGPAPWLGLRVALATALPLALATSLPHEAAIWASLAAFGVALVDKGGAYRSRATTMGAAALGGIVAVVVGGLVASSAPLAMVVTTVGVAACALSHGLGAPAIGNSIAVHLVIAAALPVEPGSLHLRALGFAGGAAWALILGLGLWPVRVYAPARRAVSAALNAVAEHAAAIAAADRGEAGWRDGLVLRHRLLRERLEAARHVLARIRRGRPGESGRGERLLAIVETCEPMVGAFVALEEVLDAGCPDDVAAVVDRGLVAHAEATRELARRVLLEHPGPRRATDGWDAASARASVIGDDPVTRALADQAMMLLARAHEDRRGAADLVDSLVDDREPSPTLVAPVAAPARAVSLREATTPTIVRHALRVGAGVLAATGLAHLLALQHASWAVLSCAVLLQPHRAETRLRTVQRVAGTVAGGVLAATLAWLIDGEVTAAVAVVLLAGISAAVLQVNHALFAAFITPTVVLLSELQTHHAADTGERVMSTVLGGAVALVASLVLWPERERDRFGLRMASALDAAAEYLDAVQARATEEGSVTPEEPAALAARRRAFGLALNEAEIALDRVLAERVPTGVLEPRMTLLTVARRMAAVLNAFASGRAVTSYAGDEGGIRLFAATASGQLASLARAVRDGRPPPAWERCSHVVADPVVAARLDRIALHLAVLRDAAARAAR